MASLMGEPADAAASVERGARAGRAETILDLAGIDLGLRRHDKAHIERYIPHRGHMSLMDAIVWESDDFKHGIGLWDVRPDEFWVPGHFPSKALLPGVLMVEAGAQLACYLYNVRFDVPYVVLFLRLDNAAFRSSVEPGDQLYVLCKETKAGRRRFSCETQGLVNGQIAFEATITGMRTDTPAG